MGITREYWTEEKINRQIGLIYNNRKILSFSHKKQSFKRGQKVGFKYYFRVLCLECNKEKLSPMNKIKKHGCRSCNCSKPHFDASDPKTVCVNLVWSNYKTGAFLRNKEFSLTTEDVSDIIFKPCIYCGKENSNISKNKIRHNGIDRINNNVGYKKENSAPCCKRCNYAKWDSDKDAFLDHIKQIYNYQFLQNNNVENIK